MSDTYGPLFESLSKSGGLQSSLESRLRALLDVNGSLEYVLTWKDWVIGSGLRICALRASARPTSGSVYTGWPSPSANGSAGEISPDLERRGGKWVNRKTGRVLQTNLATDVKLLVPAGWSTPSARDWKDTPGMATEGVNPDGSIRKRMDQLPRQAALAGWPTPIKTDANSAARGTTTTGVMHPGTSLTDAARGADTSSSPVQTEKRGALNPEFPRWLMGFPPEWASCAPTAVPSFRKSPRNS